MDNYEKSGYLTGDFKMFHLIDTERKEINFHYHDFNKILLFIQGDVTYCIEGCSYQLMPYDIVFVQAGEVHRPIINSDMYERIIIYVSPDFIDSYKGTDYDLNYCFQKAREESSNVLRMHSFHFSRLYNAMSALEHSFHENDFASSLHQKVLFLEFMIQLNRATLHEHIDYVSDNASNPKILAMLDYLNTHL